MSHIVVYESADGASGFERCGSLDAAIVAAERLRNVEGVTSPRIFKLEEVQFDFRPYFRVEVNEGDADPSPTAVERTVIPEPPVMAAPEVAAPIESPVADEVVAVAPAAESADAPEPEVEAPEATEPATDPFAEMSEPEAAADDEPVESTDWVGGADDAPTFEPEAELEAIFATDPEPVPENTGEALFDSLQDDAPDPASVFDEVAEAADDAAEEAPVVEVPEPDSMVSVRKGLFGR